MLHQAQTRRIGLASATGRDGFTIAELLITIAIMVLITSFALPKLLSAKPAANESAVISTLRSIATGQAQIKAMVSMDTDLDGVGEYGYLAEMAGSAPLREPDGAGGIQLGASYMAPDALSTAFGFVENGVVRRSGYYFKMYLPNGDSDPLGVAEDDDGGWTVGSDLDGSQAEVYWCCYAWPVTIGRTGNRAFFINQTGDLLQYDNKAIGAQYEGLTEFPEFSAAYVDEDMSGQTANSAAGPIGFDGNEWKVVQ